MSDRADLSYKKDGSIIELTTCCYLLAPMFCIFVDTSSKLYYVSFCIQPISFLLACSYFYLIYFDYALMQSQQQTLNPLNLDDTITLFFLLKSGKTRSLYTSYYNYYIYNISTIILGKLCMKRIAQLFNCMNILILRFLITGGNSEKISYQISLPSIIKNYKQTQLITLDEVSFTKHFKQIYNQISSFVYFSQHQISSDLLYNISAYPHRPDSYQNCNLYGSSLNQYLRAEFNYQSSFQIINYLIVQNQKKNEIYILGTDSNIYFYIFDRFNIKLVVKVSLSSIFTQQQLFQIKLVQVGAQILLVSLKNVYLLNQLNLVNKLSDVRGFVPINKLVDIGTFSKQKNLIWICDDKIIYIYEVLDTNFHPYLELKQKYEGFTENSIESIAFDQQKETFYLTTVNKNLFSINKNRTQNYELQYSCQKMVLIHNVLNMICRYKKSSFIAEIFVSPENLTLNRYYTQSFLPGIRDIRHLGFGRVALIGDDMTFLINRAINRNILLQLSQKLIKQHSLPWQSLGVIQIHYLGDYSTKQQSTVLIITQESIQLVGIAIQPAELVCKLQPNLNNTPNQLYVLAIFNITQCQSNQKIEADRICEIYYPFKISYKEKQLQNSTANLIMVSANLFFILLICIVAGFGNLRIKRLEKAQGKVKKKIEHLKRVGKKKQTLS